MPFYSSIAEFWILVVLLTLEFEQFHSRCPGWTTRQTSPTSALTWHLSVRLTKKTIQGVACASGHLLILIFSVHTVHWGHWLPHTISQCHVRSPEGDSLSHSPLNKTCWGSFPLVRCRRQIQEAQCELWKTITFKICPCDNHGRTAVGSGIQSF